jgi:cytochrome P450
MSKEASAPDSKNLTVDYNYWINLFTIEATSSIALSSELGLLEQGHDAVTAQKPDGTTYSVSYRKCQDATAFAHSHFCWDYKHYHSLIWLSKLLPRWRKIWSDAAPWSDMVRHQCLTRLQRYKAGEEDMEGNPYNLPWGEIAGEVGAIINAGADTTSIALTQVLYFLLRHREHLATLRKEIVNALSSSDIVAPYDKVRHLPFLKACLDERLRFIPPTSAGPPRRTPPEGAQILSQWIAGNTSVSMTAYTAHHDLTIFPNPEEFNLHRWMDPKERKRMEPYFIPFSTGGRSCLGRTISYIEQTVVLATLVHRYSFALPRPDFELERFQAFNLLIGKMPLKIWRREF